MTLKEQILQELESTPDHILQQVLDYLLFLKSKALSTVDSKDSLTSLVGQSQDTFANSEEADRFIRQERDTWDA
jgi:hypothetical protein